MARFKKHFSVEQARSWLPELRRRFEKIHSLYAELEELREDYTKVQAIIRMNGHAPKETGFEERAVALQALVKEIVDAGIEVKDVARGLVDFPHWRGGQEVFLCWELSEEDLRYWHHIDDGYPGRRPL